MELEEFLKEFKKEIEEYRDKLLSALDEKISKTELEIKNKIFKARKRVENLERQKFGFNFSIDDNGKNN